eukprot:s111_g31.t1
MILIVWNVNKVVVCHEHQGPPGSRRVDLREVTLRLTFNEQVERHGSRRQIMRLARNMCRVFTLLGLEPAGVTGATIGADAHVNPQDQCSVVSDNNDRVQVAELDTSYGGEHENRLVRAEFGLGATARDLDFLTDYASTLHYGLVDSGATMSSLLDTTGICMTEKEGNMVSFNVMGGDRCMRLVSKHFTGVRNHGDTTDERHVEGPEECESEMEVGDAMDDDTNTREHLVSRLRTLLNECLAASELTDGAAVQQMVLAELDAGQPGQTISAEVFHELLESTVQGLHVRFNRARQHSRFPMADVLRATLKSWKCSLESGEQICMCGNFSPKGDCWRPKGQRICVSFSGEDCCLSTKKHDLFHATIYACLQRRFLAWKLPWPVE